MPQYTVSISCISHMLKQLFYQNCTMMVLTNTIAATSAWETMGIPYSDLQIEFKEEAFAFVLSRKIPYTGKESQVKILWQGR